MRTESSGPSLAEIKRQIIAALTHPEAQDGLYFRNLYHLHEEDQRDAVEGAQVAILDALRDLIDEGKVLMDESGEEVIFFLVQK